MTPTGDDARVVEHTIPRAPVTRPPRPADGSSAVAGERSPSMAAQNAALNDHHAMAQMRARAGWVVRSIEGRRRRLVVDAVRRAAGARADRARVLDICCEDGWVAEGYVDTVGETILCDLDARRLRESPLAQHARVSILEDDALAPVHLARVLGPAGADVIVLSALLEHLPEPPRALEALQHHLAADGRFVIYLPADGPILFLKRVLKATRLGRLIKGLPLEPAPGHLHIFDRAATRALLAPFGTVTHLHFDPVCLGYVAIVAPEVTD